MNMQWFSQGLAGAIGLLFFLAVVPGIVQSTIGGTSNSISQGSIQTLAGDINKVCSGDENSVGGRIELDSEIELEISDDTIDVQNAPPDSDLDSFDLGCEIENEVTIEQTQPYEVINIENGGFKLT